MDKFTVQKKCWLNLFLRASTSLLCQHAGSVLTLMDTASSCVPPSLLVDTWSPLWKKVTGRQSPPGFLSCFSVSVCRGEQFICHL